MELIPALAGVLMGLIAGSMFLLAVRMRTVRAGIVAVLLSFALVSVGIVICRIVAAHAVVTVGASASITLLASAILAVHLVNRSSRPPA